MQTFLVPPPPDEATYQRQIVELAHYLGYVVAHFYALRTNHGWKTPAAADGKGWPDLVLVSGVRHRTIFAECKGPTGTLTREQKWWRDHLQEAGNEWYLWKSGTDDLASIANTLQEAPHATI